MRYAVDIPDPYSDLNFGHEWLCVGYFKTKKEAIKFAREHFGADKNGKIKIVSSL